MNYEEKLLKTIEDNGVVFTQDVFANDEITREEVDELVAKLHKEGKIWKQPYHPGKGYRVGGPKNIHLQN